MKKKEEERKRERERGRERERDEIDRYAKIVEDSELAVIFGRMFVLRKSCRRHIFTESTHVTHKYRKCANF